MTDVSNWWELTHIEDLEDCRSDCPIVAQEFNPEVAEEECAACFLNSEEYDELTDYSSLFQMALDYLVRKELCLQDSPSEYSEREKQAIIAVHREIEKWREKELDEKREGEGKKRGRELIPQGREEDGR